MPIGITVGTRLAFKLQTSSFKPESCRRGTPSEKLRSAMIAHITLVQQSPTYPKRKAPLVGISLTDTLLSLSYQLKIAFNLSV